MRHRMGLHGRDKPGIMAFFAGHPVTCHEPPPLCIDRVIIDEPDSGALNPRQHSICDRGPEAQTVAFDRTRADCPTFDKILASYAQDIAALMDMSDGRFRNAMLWM